MFVNPEAGKIKQVYNTSQFRTKLVSYPTCLHSIYFYSKKKNKTKTFVVNILLQIFPSSISECLHSVLQSCCLCSCLRIIRNTSSQVEIRFVTQVKRILFFLYIFIKMNWSLLYCNNVILKFEDLIAVILRANLANRFVRRWKVASFVCFSSKFHQANNQPTPFLTQHRTQVLVGDAHAWKRLPRMFRLAEVYAKRFCFLFV